MSEMIRIEPLRRVDVGVADHELFEDVVLDRARELVRRHALLLGGHDVERQDRQHRAVHGHRHAHLVERDAGEQRAHVVDRVDGDARHADIARHARMVGIVAAVGGEIEGDREALLPGREVAPVEGVGILGRGEAGILADGPGLVDVHGRVGAAQVTARCPDRCRGSRARRGPRGRRIPSPRCPPASARARPPACRGGCQGSVHESDARKIRDAGHGMKRMPLPVETDRMRCILGHPPVRCYRCMVGGPDSLLVIPGLVPGIHVFTTLWFPRRGWPEQARP